MSNSSSIRSASHAGSWYESKSKNLSNQLSNWLDEAINDNNTNNTDSNNNNNNIRAIICPHAGYYYSGSTAAYSFKHINPTKIKRIFILGPSHHYYTKKCELTQATHYETPIINLTIDKSMNNELYKSGAFSYMDNEVDEAEHSIEMQLPFIAQILNNNDASNIPIVPILVGSLSSDSEAQYGKLLSKYLDDPANFFVISSDFCHWGSRFDYQYYDKSHGEIYESIENLDKEGMKNIESMDPKSFEKYQKQYKNTICGRHPIAVLLNAINNSSNKSKFQLKFIKYKQSSQCKKMSDSSVSYAAGILIQNDNTNNNNNNNNNNNAKK